MLNRPPALYTSPPAGSTVPLVTHVDLSATLISAASPTACSTPALPRNDALPINTSRNREPRMITPYVRSPERQPHPTTRPYLQLLSVTVSSTRPRTRPKRVASRSVRDHHSAIIARFLERAWSPSSIRRRSSLRSGERYATAEQPQHARRNHETFITTPSPGAGRRADAFGLWQALGQKPRPCRHSKSVAVAQRNEGTGSRSSSRKRRLEHAPSHAFTSGRASCVARSAPANTREARTNPCRN